ncbi:MAG: hypothetical protein WBN75_03135 [Verrucomicrobiia bacterium]|jgi:hypothetical protein
MKNMIDASFPMIKALSIIMAGLFSIVSIAESRDANDGDHLSYNGLLKAKAKNNEKSKYCISNEFICAELGRFIGLPIPPCGIVYAKEHPIKHWFASLNFNLSADDLPVVESQKCADELPRLSTGVSQSSSDGTVTSACFEQA